MGWMGLWWLLIAAAIVAVILLAPSTSHRGDRGQEPPERIVKRRYARGEIDRATYERMLEDLRR